MAGQVTIVLVTGANAGIGFDTTAALAASSAVKYHVIMCSRSPEKGAKALAELKAKPGTKEGSLTLVQLDVTDQESIAAAAETVESSFGRLDILINNAGIVSTAPSFVGELRETFDANVFGAAAVTEAFVPLLKKSSDPRLIYVSSGLGSIASRLDQSSPYYKLAATAYRMSKAALNMLAACHKVDFEEWGCKVWACCPGYVITNLTGEGDRERRKASGALSSETSAKFLLTVVEGKRDGDVGKHIHEGGVYPW